MIYSIFNRIVIFLSMANLCNSFIFSDSNHNPSTTVRKNVISISPGGIKGFYYLGTLYYIKKNYDINKYDYLGASAGSWNSLFLCYKGDDDDMIQKLFEINFDQPLAKCGKMVKDMFLNNYNTDDFYLERLNIGLTELGRYNKFKLRYTTYSSFIDLEDALDCCLASSHIPFIIGGGPFKRYKKKFSFDGGLKKDSYIKPKNSILHVSSNLWNNTKYMNMPGIRKKNNFNPKLLFKEGFNDAETNKKTLDNIFNDINS